MNVLRVVGFICAICAFLFFFDSVEFFNNISRADNFYLSWALLITILSPLLPAFRLYLILSIGDLKKTYPTCIRVVFCGAALNLFLPARGGDFAKIGYLGPRGQNSFVTLSGLVIMERVLDVLALSIIGLLASLLLSDAIIASFCIGCGFLAVFGIFSLPKLASIPIVKKKCHNLQAVASKVRGQKSKLCGCLIVCCFSWLTNTIIVGFLLKAFDDSMSFIHSLAVTPPSIVIGILPVSLWGIGTRDVALNYFLAGSVSVENVISAGFLYTVLVYWLLGLLGTPFLMISGKTIRPSKETRHCT